MRNLYIKIVLSICAVFLVSSCSTRYKNSSYTPRVETKNLSSGLNKKSYSHPTMKPYTVRGIRYYPSVVRVGETFDGVASWYGPNFNGKKTSNGEIYDMYKMTAAHKTLPMNTIVKVTNKDNGKTAIVRINDRGPFVKSRIIDLSKKAAYAIDMTKKGTAKVKLEILGFQKQGLHTIPTPKAMKSLPKTIKLGNYLLQIGSFENFVGAQKTQKRYNGQDGYKAVIRDVEYNNQRYFKVMLSGFKSEQEALDYRDKKFKDGFLIRE